MITKDLRSVCWITRVSYEAELDAAFPHLDVLRMHYAPTGWADTQYRFAVIGRN